MKSIRLTHKQGNKFETCRFFSFRCFATVYFIYLCIWVIAKTYWKITAHSTLKPAITYFIIIWRIGDSHVSQMSWSKIAFEGVTKGLGDIAGRKESYITHGTRQATTETLVEEGWCHISLGTKQNATAASIMITSCNTIPEGVLPIMAYTGRLRPKGVPFLGSLKLWKGKEICHFGRYKGRKGLTDESYGCEKVEKTVWFCNLFIF